MKVYYVYILASEKNGTLYIGVTNDLVRRMNERKSGFIEAFTSKYGVVMLVYFEKTHDIYNALKREKQLKKWNRAWKIELIESVNPEWNDLAYELRLGVRSFVLSLMKGIIYIFKRLWIPSQAGNDIVCGCGSGGLAVT